jgi:hypothetical protein
MHAGDVVKWVPASQGDCLGYDDPAYGGALQPGPDGWGQLVVTVSLSKEQAPYALCTKEVYRGASVFSHQPHVLARVSRRPPSMPPPPAPPALPWGAAIKSLLASPTEQHLPTIVIEPLPATIGEFVGNLSLASSVSLALLLCALLGALLWKFGCMRLEQEMPSTYLRLSEEASGTSTYGVGATAHSGSPLHAQRLESHRRFQRLSQRTSPRIACLRRRGSASLMHQRALSPWTVQSHEGPIVFSVSRLDGGVRQARCA